MSTVIENSVVEMSFDNSNFEKNAKTSLSTIEKLKNALDFSGSSNSLNELSRSANNFSMGSMGSTIETISSKFSALEIVGVGALLRIGQQAVDTGERLVKSMSTDQIMAGWDKFAKKTTSTATLLGQGFDMEEVNEQLERLNWFTDETSYNFTDMVDSIGKFTASGKGLTESVDAMQGIANWAALSGQNAQTASRAMYQISQAMGAGVMRKEDYKSIQNAAMDTDEFRQKALDAAVALGTLKKNADGTYSSLKAAGKGAEAFNKSQFTEKLTEGMWFTDEVMMKVFNDYSAGLTEVNQFIDELADDESLLTSEILGAKEALDKGGDAFEEYAKDLDIHDDTVDKLKDLVSNLDDFGMKAFGAAQKARTFEDAIDSVKDAASTTWMNIFGIFFGDAEKATEIWTDLANYLYDVFVEPLNSLQKTLEEWVSELDNDGDDIIQIFRNIAGIAESIVEPIKDAFSEIFPKTSKENFKKFIDNLNKLLKNMKLDVLQSRKLKNAFIGLFTIIKQLLGIVKKIVKSLSPLYSLIEKLLRRVLNLGEAFGLLVTKSKLADSIFGKISASVDSLSRNIKSFLENTTSNILVFFNKIKSGENVLKAFGSLIYKEFRLIADSIINSISDVIEAITGIDVKFVGNFLNKVFDYGAQAVRNFVDNIKNKGGIKGVVTILFDLLKNVGLAVIQIVEEITGVDLSNAEAKFSELTESIKKQLMDFVSSFDGIDSITDKFLKLRDALDRIKSFFSGIIQSIKNFFQPVLNIINEICDQIAIQIKLNPIGNIFKIAILTKILNIFKDIDNVIESFNKTIDNTSKLTSAITNTANTITNALKSMQAEVNSKIIKSIAASILLIAVALFILSKVEAEKIENVMIMFGSAIAGLVGSFAILAGASNLLSVSGVLKIIPVMIVLAACIAKLSESLSLIASTYKPNDADAIIYNISTMIELIMVLVASIELINLIVTGLNISVKQIMKIFIVAEVCKIIATAAGELASALAILNGTDPWSILTAFGTLSLMLALLFEEIKGLTVLKTTSAKSIIATAAALYIIGQAVKGLAEAVKVLTDVDPKSIVIPFIALSVMMNVLMNNASSLSNRKVFISTAIALLALAVAVKILADEAIKLSELDFDQLVEGFAVLGGALFGLTVVLNNLKSDLLQGAIAIAAVAISLWILTNAIKMVAELELWSTIRAVGLLIVSLYALVKMAEQMKGSAEAAAGVMALAASLVLIAYSFKILENIDPAKLLASAVVLLATAFFMIKIADIAENSLKGIAALAIISASLLAFAFALSLIGAMDPKQFVLDMLIAMGSLAAIVVIIGVIGAAFNAIGPIILIGVGIFAAALVLLGIGLAALGLGLTSIASGINVLDAVGAQAVEALTTIGSALSSNMKTFLEGGPALILLGVGMIVAAAGAAVLAIAGAAVAIALALIGIGLLVLAGGLALVNLALGGFYTNAINAVTALALLTTGMITYTPGILTASAALLAVEKTFNKLSDIFKSFANSATSLSTALALINLGIVTFTEGVIEFENSSNKFTKACQSMTNKSVIALSAFGTSLSTSTKVAFNNANKSFTIMGQNLVIGFVKGINSKTGLAYAALKVMAARCIAITRTALKIHSPSRAFKEIGDYTVAGFAKGLSDTKASDEAAESMGESAINSLNAAMTSAVDNLNSDTNDPVIKPLMDLSDIQNGSEYLDAMTSRDRAASISTTYKSNRELDEEVNSRNNSLLSGISNQLSSAMSGEDGSGMPVNVNITLAGDAEGLFRVIMNENSRMIKTRGYSPLLR